MEHTAGSGICTSSHIPHPSQHLTKKNATVLMKTASLLSEWTERRRIGSGGFEISVQLPFLYPLEAGRLHTILSAKITRIDETEPVATRPLAIQKDGTWYTYGHDLTKNVWELYKANGTIATAYDYAPFGEVTASGTAEQPFQWSSEFYDTELGMVYYNFRFYNPLDGRWISRDLIGELLDKNIYGYVLNRPIELNDFYGLAVLTTVEDYYAYVAADTAARAAAAKTAALAAAGGLAIAEKEALEEAIQQAIDKIISRAQELIRIRGKDRWKRCAPCDPKVGTIMYRIDETGKEHYCDITNKHVKIHTHYMLVTQTPALANPSCRCEAPEVRTVPGRHPYGIKERKVTGGGLIGK